MKLKKPYTLPRCLKLGLFSNISFVCFIIICLLYYYLFDTTGIFLFGFEVAAYFFEALGFVLMAFAIIGFSVTVRQRTVMKGLMLLYLLIEVALMLLDFGFIRLSFYDGNSALLIVLHALFSAGVGVSYLQLDPRRTKLEISVIVAVSIMLAGMLSLVFKYRVYGSILMNAFAYIYLYARMLHLLKQEEMEVDCYGDRARVQVYKSTFFD